MVAQTEERNIYNRKYVCSGLHAVSISESLQILLYYLTCVLD